MASRKAVAGGCKLKFIDFIKPFGFRRYVQSGERFSSFEFHFEYPQASREASKWMSIPRSYGSFYTENGFRNSLPQSFKEKPKAQSLVAEDGIPIRDTRGYGFPSGLPSAVELADDREIESR